MKKRKWLIIGTFLFIIFSIVGVTIYFSYTEAKKNYSELTKSNEKEKKEKVINEAPSIKRLNFDSLYYSLFVNALNRVVIDEKRLKYEIVRTIVSNYPNQIQNLEISINETLNQHSISIRIIWKDGREETITKQFRKVFNIK